MNKDKQDKQENTMAKQGKKITKKKAKKKHISKKVSVKRSRAGLGLFIEEDVHKGEFIIEYTGEIISTEESDRRGGKYLFELSSKRRVDGKSRKNLARYINHSCRPNCDTEVKGSRIFVMARRKILSGEELSYDYGKEYVDEHIKPFGCKCLRCLGR